MLLSDSRRFSHGGFTIKYEHMYMYIFILCPAERWCLTGHIQMSREQILIYISPPPHTHTHLYTKWAIEGVNQQTYNFIFHKCVKIFYLKQFMF
jgi:hypothetical protein